MVDTLKDKFNSWLLSSVLSPMPSIVNYHSSCSSECVCSAELHVLSGYGANTWEMEFQKVGDSHSNSSRLWGFQWHAYPSGGWTWTMLKVSCHLWRDPGIQGLQNSQGSQHHSPKSNIYQCCSYLTPGACLDMLLKHTEAHVETRSPVRNIVLWKMSIYICLTSKCSPYKIKNITRTWYILRPELEGKVG